MGILKAENNVAYTANNACRIYIIKQEDYENRDKFSEDYAQILGDATSLNKFFNSNNATHSGEKDIKLVPLISFDKISNLYEDYRTNTNASDCPIINGKKIEHLYFLSSLQELRNCPLLDLSKLAYVFQIDGQAKSGLANVLSFNVNFSVNGQSSAELVINNKDFKYNFKYFSDKTKYPYHLRSYFDTNDIIIIRYQKKNVTEMNLLNSFKRTKIDYWKDPYIGSKEDPFVTVFTGYINDVNNSFSFTNGQQMLTLNCTGPSKKLTWTRFLSNKAVASKDAASAILPISAFVNPQTMNDNGKTNIENDDVIANAVIRTYSGIMNIPEVKKAYDDFVDAFDKKNHLKTTGEIEDLNKKIKNETDTKKLQELNKQLNQRKSELDAIITKSRDDYNNAINANMKNFYDKKEGSNQIGIRKCSFINSDNFGKIPYLFVISGTNQPAYQWTFNNWSSMFQSDFSTVYQFIKGIADNLQFNFYDDPYGTIHFSIPDMSLVHLQSGRHPNNLNQLLNFSETQNTENIANVQFCTAKYTYNLPFDFINTVAKDYLSIKKYGEKVMQPFSMVGLINPAAIRYAAKMRMTKYNRKALSNIRITLNGEPNLEFDKYAYIKSLRKLFYIESYSHSYNAGGDFTTSLNGTYTRDILALANLQTDGKEKIDSASTNITSTLFPTNILSDDKLSLNVTDSSVYTQKLNDYWLNKQLVECASVEDILKTLDKIEFPKSDVLNQKIYQIYVDNFGYPADDENVKLEVGSMYTADILKQCYLDGFLWALPFDVDPYQIAVRIQQDELESTRQLNKTFNNKKEAKTNVAKNNANQVKNIAKGNNKPTKAEVKKIIGIDLLSGIKNIFNLQNYFRFPKKQEIPMMCKLTPREDKGK